jgi:hypothetical protein
MPCLHLLSIREMRRTPQQAKSHIQYRIPPLRTELDEHRARLKLLIGAELVNVAAGYLSTKELIDSALETLWRQSRPAALR